MLFFSGEPSHYSFTFASTRPALFSPKDRDIQGAYDYIPQKLRTTFSSRRQFILHNSVNRLRLSLGIGEHARFDDAGSRTRCVISNHPLSKVLGPPGRDSPYHTQRITKRDSFYLLDTNA